MKILLREHVDNLGDRGEIVSVAAGYARNYLLPKGLAYEATPGNIQVLNQQRRVWAAKEAREVGEAEALARRLQEIRLSVTKKAGESGTLYGSVTTGEIAELLKVEGVEIDRRRLQLTEPIKSVGSYPVSVKVHRQVNAQFQIEVLAEQATE